MTTYRAAGAKKSLALCTTLLPLVAATLPGCMAEEHSDEDLASAAHLEPASTRYLLADRPRCGSHRVGPGLDAACAAESTTVDAGPIADVYGARIEPGRTYDVRLQPVGDHYEGTVWLTTYTGGEFNVYLGTPNIPFDIDNIEFGEITEDGPGTRAICSHWLPRLDGGCPDKFRGAYVFQPDPTIQYRLEFGPTDRQWVRVHLAQRSEAGFPGTDNYLPRRCENSDLPRTAEVCADASESTPIRAATLGGATPPTIIEGTNYGVRLPEVSGRGEGSVTFVPDDDGDYVMYLGGRAVWAAGIALAQDDMNVQLECDASLHLEHMTALTGGPCREYTRASILPGLIAGTPVRIDIGRLERQAFETRWLRMRIVKQPDAVETGP
ncbi:MAG: hypothetical protein B7733_24040 [Myxococcales bacterium FL481]|nr:MAG: hypothetical protein B7733_24040 [Myxococcales bacterium FL481]